MYSIAFVIPYFGKLPEMFPLWVDTVASNDDISFLFFTDQEPPSKMPKNIKWNKMTFDEMKTRIDQTVGFTTAVYTPYKLCDVRPCYGDIFQRELQGYDFWGFCDIDLIFGHIRDFITNELLEKYDKIGAMGHCVLIKNSDIMRTMYKQKLGNEYPYKIILACKDNLSFDEGGMGDYGFPNICKAHGINEIWRRWFTDIYTQTYEFRHKQYRGDQVYYREIKSIQILNGNVWVTNKDDGSRFATMYVHFQGRRMVNEVKDTNAGYYVIPNRFVSNVGSDQELEKDRKCFVEGKKKKHINSMKKKLRLFGFFILHGKIADKGWRNYLL